MCEGGIKTNIRPKEFYRTGTAPPGFEISESATGYDAVRQSTARTLVFWGVRRVWNCLAIATLCADFNLKHVLLYC